MAGGESRSGGRGGEALLHNRTAQTGSQYRNLTVLEPSAESGTTFLGRRSHHTRCGCVLPVGNRIRASAVTLSHAASLSISQSYPRAPPSQPIRSRDALSPVRQPTQNRRRSRLRKDPHAETLNELWTESVRTQALTHKGIVAPVHDACR